MTILRALLEGAIDYAGLFPPAGLQMLEAVDQYAEYRSSDATWALGRFIVPASRLEEFETAAGRYLEATEDTWRLSALVGPSIFDEQEAVEEFNRRHAAGGAAAALVDAVEVKAHSIEMIGQLAEVLPRELDAYIEIPIEHDPAPLVTAIGRAGARAKVRTGGVTADAFPAAPALARFLRACTDTGVPFKATAGLHHPMRAEYRLTYAPDSPCGTMYGFLNLFLAAAFLRNGMSEADALELLEERSPEAFAFAAESVSWRGHRLDTQAIRRARREAIVAFGSCSFVEPIGELREMGLLP